MPRTDLLLGGRPVDLADLACFLATDGRRHTGGTHAGQILGQGNNPLPIMKEEKGREIKGDLHGRW